MVTFDYYNALISEIDDNSTYVTNIVRGISWTAAVLSDGGVGVAMHTEGDSFPRIYPNICGMKIKEAAGAVLSWNMEEANEGMAVINAFFNRAEKRASLKADTEGGTLAGINVAGRTVGIIGHLVGHGDITEELLADAAAYYIIEKEPRPGDYPDSACEYLLPKCDLVIITGSAAMNKTMPRLLQLSKDADVVLTGPSVPLCPALFDFGIKKLHGRVITESEAMLNAIVEKRTSVNKFSVPFNLCK